MEVFYSRSFEGGLCTLDPEESGHCVRVLRHREGDEIFVIDGEGTLYTCVLTDASPKGAIARIVKEEPDWGAHPYWLQMAVCPTKNLDRYEWFAEKATELGLDEIVPVIGEHSERRVFKPERLRRILLSASKQSLKGAIPAVAEPLSVKEFIRASSPDDLRLICCCFEGEVPRLSINDALAGGQAPASATSILASLRLSNADSRTCPTGKTTDDEGDCGAGDGLRGAFPDRVLSGSPMPAPDRTKPTRIVVLIGPEGDFSREEAAMAIAAGFIPVHLGPSRLRTETAALTAVEAVYLHNI
jgi:16S rRNA (uracil1498-N3)-methyltransferase